MSSAKKSSSGDRTDFQATLSSIAQSLTTAWAMGRRLPDACSGLVLPNVEVCHSWIIAVTIKSPECRVYCILLLIDKLLGEYMRCECVRVGRINEMSR